MKSRKNKGYKIQNYGRIFDSSERRRKKRARNSVLFVLSILVLVFLGYSISGPLTNLLSGQKTPRPSDTSSKAPTSSQMTSSEIKDIALESEKPSTLSDYKAAFLPLATASDSTKLSEFIKSIKAQGYNAAVLELKNEDGTIFYATQNTMAAEVKAVSETAITNLSEIISKLKSENIVPIANIHAFKDKVATKNKDAKILYEGKENWSWFDSANGKPWLNPYRSAAQDYIISLSCELVDLGFENIMVSSVMFPDVRSFKFADFGELEKTVSHAEILTQFATKLKTAVNEKKAKLLLCYDAFKAQEENNVVYGGANPSTFSADALVPALSVYTENSSQIAEIVSSLKLGATPLMPKFIFAEGTNKEQIDAQKELCKDCSIYIFDKNGNYIG